MRAFSCSYLREKIQQRPIKKQQRNQKKKEEEENKTKQKTKNKKEKETKTETTKPKQDAPLAKLVQNGGRSYSLGRRTRFALR